MKTVTICGSMRFEQKMRDIAWVLETQYGMNVLQCVYTPENVMCDERMLKNLKKAHYRKIEMSDAVYVIDIDGYIGISTKREVEYAKKSGKEVMFHSAFMA